MTTNRPECGRPTHDPEMWTVTTGQRPGSTPMFTAANYEAARICNTICPILNGCLHRALTAPPGLKPRGLIQGGYYFDDRAQAHRIPQRPNPTKYLDTLRSIQKRLKQIRRDGSPAEKTEYKTLIQQRREIIQYAIQHTNTPPEALAKATGHTTSFIYKQATEKP